MTNLQSSQSPLEIEGIAVRAAGDTEGIKEYNRVANFGTLSPGSSLEVSLTTRVESPGTKNLRVIVYGHPVGKPSETTQVEHPVSFTVRDRDPRVDIRADDAVEGITTDGTVEIANGLESELTNIEVKVSGTDVKLVDNLGIIASLSPGETATVPIRFRARSAGLHELAATVNYTVDESARRTVNRSTTIQASPLGEGAKVTASAVGSGPEQALVVDIINPMEQPIQNVVLSATSNNATFDESIVSSVPPGESRQVRLNSTVAQPPATARVTAEYSIGDIERSANTTAEMRSNAGSITLTGLDVTRENGRVRISGSASNVGMSAAESVIVSVQNTERVDPAHPNKEYFVGTVPSSDFVSFDVYARTTGNVSTVPLTVSYSLDGDRAEHEFDAEIEGTNTTAQQFCSESSMESSVVLGIGGLIIIAVGAIIVIGWRSSRDGS
ncbi:COG1361 family protein [Haloarcula sediminis]|uniref:hypothetical protein n=1 Tax=Haloarcula sediminis TaxID=3111777 RepID=UPI002D786ECC|nr:hypothetical protein [Haloarcula sp. CK38]